MAPDNKKITTPTFNWKASLNDYFGLINALILLGFLALAYFFILSPKITAVETTIRGNIEAQQQLLRDQRIKLSSLKMTVDLYGKIRPEDLKKLNSILPDDYPKEKLFGEIAEIIINKGFILNSVALSQSPAGSASQPGSTEALNPNVGQVSINLSVGGTDYIGFKSLLRILERNNRLFDMNDRRPPYHLEPRASCSLLYFYQTSSSAPKQP